MLTAELLTVGTELLMGQILNTNAQYLSQQLAALGINVYHQVTVGDNEARLEEALAQAVSRSDIVLMTGGLGPTQDDLTKRSVAELFGVPMERDAETVEKLQSYFRSLGREMTPNNLSQADFPQRCTILQNDRGTAPGCIVEKDRKTVILMPGPPAEMTSMFQKHVRGYLEKRSGYTFVSNVLRIYGLGESAVEHRLRDLIETQGNPTIAPYAQLGEVTLRVTARCRMGEDPAPLLQPTVQTVVERLGDKVYSKNDEKLEFVAANLLRAQRKTLAIAESCTGGMLTSKLTGIPGISECLLESAVVYSNAAKQRRLGVPEGILERSGAVSEATARAMAEGMQRSADADVALATTGIAGPGGGTEQKPVGLVYIALAARGGATWAVRQQMAGTRERIRTLTCLHALDFLRRYLLGIL